MRIVNEEQTNPEQDELTGVPEIDDLLTNLADVEMLSLEDQGDVYDEAHRLLHETLLSASEAGET